MHTQNAPSPPISRYPSRNIQRNRLRYLWLTIQDPAIKIVLNNKTTNIKTRLQSHRRDDSEKFLDTFDPLDNSFYKLNRNFLNKKPATHPLNGPNCLIFSVSEMADTYKDQFRSNPGQELSKRNNKPHQNIKSLQYLFHLPKLCILYSQEPPKSEST